MPSSECVVDFCAGLHEPDHRYHASAPELHPLEDGSALTITTVWDERTAPDQATVLFGLIVPSGVDSALGEDLLQGIREAGLHMLESGSPTTLTLVAS